MLKRSEIISRRPSPHGNKTLNNNAIEYLIRPLLENKESTRDEAWNYSKIGYDYLDSTLISKKRVLPKQSQSACPEESSKSIGSYNEETYLPPDQAPSAYPKEQLQIETNEDPLYVRKITVKSTPVDISRHLYKFI